MLWKCRTKILHRGLEGLVPTRSPFGISLNFSLVTKFPEEESHRNSHRNLIQTQSNVTNRQ